MIGREDVLQDIFNYLQDEKVHTIGIFGMGGIGKTTVLMKIEQALQKNRRKYGFEFVILVTAVSKFPNIPRIQNQIATCMGLSLSSQEHEYQRASTLLKHLKDRMYVLLIDDVWQALDFKRIGIPLPNNDDNIIKLVFTTRSRQVCIDMDADIKVGMTALNEEQSMELFELKVSLEGMLPKPILHPYVKQIVTKCGGLPLVLITIARAISGCVTIGEWEYTIQILSSAPEEIRGMDDVMRLLKFSFDHLKDEGIKSCLLYCALYPEDANIYTKDLIKMWIGEGFLDRSHDGTRYDFNRFYERGIFVIKTLKSSCLLENGNFSLNVKMHDSIREMAFWLTRKNCDSEYVLVYDKCNGCDIYDYHRWSRATRISLIRCQIDHLPGGGIPKCSKLLTLLLSKNDKFYKFPSHDFFRFMPLLRVMDLSCTSLSVIPTSIGSLVELRYLNLNFTKILKLPLALGKLKKLELLNLSYTSQLKKIPKSAITGLLRLQELRLFCSAYEWDLNEPHNSYFVTSESQLLKLDDLKYLKYIEDFAMDICSTSILQKLINNQVLSHAITCISLKDINLTDDLLMKIFSNIHGLSKLVIVRCNLPNVLQFDRYGYLPHLQILIFKELNISNVVLTQTCSLHSLQSLLIFKCPMLKELTWVSQLPFLERFCLIDCEGVDEIVVSSDVDGLYFPKLVCLYIENLKNARRLSREDGHFLYFRSLKVLKVIKCPMLRNLCFGLESAKNINLISGGQEWWDTLD
ncbi:NB-ARC domain-containing disease resistance protein [Zostera marina]|uniref:NB-ARC domain-containing disease resistance protein n=1 Tax=Zostera marina TaxID=29655 RepID=A0A0K9PKT9_ZOSMR|nr:NB-ARC domain-containing disease resistance protein [Zostera marina]